MDLAAGRGFDSLETAGSAAASFLQTLPSNEELSCGGRGGRPEVTEDGIPSSLELDDGGDFADCHRVCKTSPSIFSILLTAALSHLLRLTRLIVALC